MWDLESVLDKRGESRQLIVLLHGYGGSPKGLRLMTRRIEQADGLKDMDVLCPPLPFGVFSAARPLDVVADLLALIDEAWAARCVTRPAGYDRIVLVGQSMGGLYARKVYVAACGQHPMAPLDPELKKAYAWGGNELTTPRPWTPAVERIVLLAAMNRGFSISHHLSVPNAIIWSAGVAVGSLFTLLSGRRPTVFAARRGSPFTTQLRVQWLRMMNRAEREGEPGSAMTIQLLGTVDDMVSPEDSIDLVAGKDFIYIDVPLSDHRNVSTMDDTPAGTARSERFLRAITNTRAQLSDLEAAPADDLLMPEEDVTDVVFVIHGIRDKGYWTHRIAREVMRQAKGSKVERNGQLRDRIVTSETSTYGYFPMLSFLWPRRRRAKVEWLMDQYAESLAKYPNAEFMYVGHSNGTYLLARALKLYPSCRFTNVVFAGSVVRRKFEWNRYIRADQVENVLNFVATRRLGRCILPQGNADTPSPGPRWCWT